MSDWFIVEECLKDDNGETEVCTNVDYITKLSLKKRIPRQSQWFANISIDINSSLFRSELMQAYIDMEFPAALIHKMI
ncbi:unnamed protein product [Rhizophagus irregularis]|nr:unnamed protein product [Rhizophagus irregularis]